MTAPLWVSQALNAHAATIRIDILLSMIPLLKSDRLPRPRRKCEIRTVRSRTLGNCHCARTAALIFVMAETRETYQPTRDTVFGRAGRVVVSPSDHGAPSPGRAASSRASGRADSCP